MKTIILYIVFICIVFSLDAQTTILEEDFENEVFPPLGWVSFRGVDNTGTVNDWITTTESNTGNSAAFSRYSNQGIGVAEDWLVSSQIDLTNSVNSKLSFFSKEEYGETWISQYEIRVSTNSQSTHTDFYTVATFGDFSLDYTEIIVDLSVYDGQLIYIAFVHTDEYQDDWYLDDISVSSQYFVVDNITYRQTSETTVEVNSACMPNINIPEFINYGAYTFTVNSINDLAFAYCEELVTISLPDSISLIGSDAFLLCTNLQSVVIPENVSFLNDRLFYGCSSLTSVTLPDTLLSIYQRTFFDCVSLETINLPTGLQSIGFSAFYGCESLTSLIIPENITSIEEFTFYGCVGISSFDIPASVNSIEESAFGQCIGLTDVTVNWNTPLDINSLAFTDTSISTISLFVPAGTITLYESAPVWQDFFPIVESGGYNCSIDNTADPNINLGRENETNLYAQEFVANCDGDLDKFSFFARVLPEVEQVLDAGTLKVYEGNPETGSIIYSQDFDAIVPVDDGELQFDLNNNIQLIENQTYSIEIPVTFLNISIRYQDSYPNGSPYINGTLESSEWDFFFKVDVIEESLTVTSKNTQRILLFPNPTSNYITVKNLKNDTNYVIRDVFGKQINVGRISQNQNITVNHLKKGLYFITFEQYKTLKFVVK